MPDHDERYSCLALKGVPGVGGILNKRLIERFGSAGAVLQAGPSQWSEVEGLGPRLIETLRSYRPDQDTLHRELDRIDEMEFDLVGLNHPRYPGLLKAIEDPPPVLYIKGTLRPEDDRAIALVGARRASGYGRSVTERLSRALVQRGFTIVSGMARGIDGWAHQAALDVPGRTMAVLGCGLDILYPPEHGRLREQIEDCGAVLSEFPLGTPPDPGNFPQRNRIISGMSVGVVVVEAAARSGSLITARLALEQGREVFAVPGPVGTRTSIGTHSLIKQGAKLVDGVEDILEELLPGLSAIRGGPVLQDELVVGPSFDLLPDERLVYDGLSLEPRHIDEITASVRWRPSRMAGLLLQLELKGAVRQFPGNMFTRIE